MERPLINWIGADEAKPPDGEKVLCVTQTKKGTMNQVIGYWMEDSQRWVCGMNGNVVAWSLLPQLPD